jgi:hypothetical protein
MANARTGNVWHVDSAGALETSKRILVSDILLTTNAAGDTVVIGSTSSSAVVLTLKNAVDESTEHYQFMTPLVFPNGLYIQSITSGAKVMLKLAGTDGGN